MGFKFCIRPLIASIAALLCLMACKLAVGEATSGGESTTTITADDIFAVWKLRQESREPLRVDIEEERTYLRGSMFLSARAKGSRRVNGRLPTLPESDETYTARSRFLFSAATARRDDMTPQWNADDGAFNTLFHVNARDPLAVWGFEHSPDPAWREWLNGGVGMATTESKGFGVDSGQLAVLLHIRPFSNEVEHFVNAAEWHVAPSPIANGKDEGLLRLVARRTQFGAKLT